MKWRKILTDVALRDLRRHGVQALPKADDVIDVQVATEPLDDTSAGADGRTFEVSRVTFVFRLKDGRKKPFGYRRRISSAPAD